MYNSSILFAHTRNVRACFCAAEIVVCLLSQELLSKLGVNPATLDDRTTCPALTVIPKRSTVVDPAIKQPEADGKWVSLAPSFISRVDGFRSEYSNQSLYLRLRPTGSEFLVYPFPPLMNCLGKGFQVRGVPTERGRGTVVPCHRSKQHASNSICWLLYHQLFIV